MAVQAKARGKGIRLSKELPALAGIQNNDYLEIEYRVN